jgi:energy-coupling factor transporter ATP-binding protein EcfA2
VQAANQIFCTTKFNALKTINLRKGVGSQAFLLELEAAGRQRRQYFSEKNLSLGELCILKLLRMLKDCPIGTLVLIDELELALHPTAQTELLKYLEHIAGEKSLTVIVSTHSATIIKQASRRQILLLEANDQGEVICTSNCFPSYVLGTLADREESASDVVVYVEDEAAQAIVSQLVKRFTAEQFAVHSLLPSVSVVPVGGFANVLRFFVHQRPLLPAVTRAYVVLDADAEPSLANAQVPEIIRIYRNERRAISFLPFTPEVGLVAFLHAERARLLQDLRVHYSNNTLSLRQNDLDPIPPDGQGQRAACKRIVDAVCTHLVGQLPNTEAAEVRQTLFKLLAEHTFATQRPAIMQQFGPIIRG